MMWAHRAAAIAMVAALVAGCGQSRMISPPKVLKNECRHGRPDIGAIRRVVSAIDDGNYLTGDGYYFLVKYMRADGGVIASWDPATLVRVMPKADKIYRARWDRVLTGRVAIPDHHEPTLGERWISTEVRFGRGTRLGWIDTLSHDMEDVCTRL
jgi:hypothetical protein